MSLENARYQVEHGGKPDEWLSPSEAQYTLLTGDSSAYVKSAYKAAKNAGKSGFSVDSEADQVRVFWRLGLFPERCSAALEGLGIAANPPGPATTSPTGARLRNRIIVGTGHRADAPGRKSPRFPNTGDAIAKAKSWLREQLEAEKAKTTGTVSAIGGAASGTDLLFHEACDELGIPTTVILAIPRDGYCQQSVVDGGPDWVEKYNRLLNTRPVLTLGDTAELPIWADFDSELRGLPAWQHLDDGERAAATECRRHTSGAVERAGRRGAGRHRRHGQACAIAWRESLRQKY